MALHLPQDPSQNLRMPGMALVLPMAKRLPPPPPVDTLPPPPPVCMPLCPTQAWFPLNLSFLSRIFLKPPAGCNHFEPPAALPGSPQGQLSPCRCPPQGGLISLSPDSSAASLLPPLPLCLSRLRKSHFLPKTFLDTSSPVSPTSSLVPRDILVSPGLKPPEGKKSVQLGPGTREAPN